MNIEGIPFSILFNIDTWELTECYQQTQELERESRERLEHELTLREWNEDYYAAIGIR